MVEWNLLSLLTYFEEYLEKIFLWTLIDYKWQFLTFVRETTTFPCSLSHCGALETSFCALSTHITSLSLSLYYKFILLFIECTLERKPVRFFQ
jgi:hypothetical protein